MLSRQDHRGLFLCPGQQIRGEYQKGAAPMHPCAIASPTHRVSLAQLLQRVGPASIICLAQRGMMRSTAGRGWPALLSLAAIVITTIVRAGRAQKKTRRYTSGLLAGGTSGQAAADGIAVPNGPSCDGLRMMKGPIR